MLNSQNSKNSLLYLKRVKIPVTNTGAGIFLMRLVKYELLLFQLAKRIYAVL